MSDKDDGKPAVSMASQLAAARMEALMRAKNIAKQRSAEQTESKDLIHERPISPKTEPQEIAANQEKEVDQTADTGIPVDLYHIGVKVNYEEGIQKPWSAEIDINDAPKRRKITRPFFSDDVLNRTGTALTVKGRYMANDEDRSRFGADEKPLHVHLQSRKLEEVKQAIDHIYEAMNDGPMDNHPQFGNLGRDHSYSEDHQARITPTHTGGPVHDMERFPLPSRDGRIREERVEVRFRQCDVPDLKIKAKLIGSKGTNVRYIGRVTGCRISVEPKHDDPQSSIYIALEHTDPEALALAKKLTESLVACLEQDRAALERAQDRSGDHQQQQQQQMDWDSMDPEQRRQWEEYYKNYYYHQQYYSSETSGSGAGNRRDHH
eukprot:Clim_evm3s39 gene=Clim_evmTU3s39